MFFAALAFGAGVTCLAADRPAPKFLSAKPDQAEGAQVLAGFRHAAIQGSYWLQFDLRILPRKGDERVLKGQMFGIPEGRGTATRLILDDPANQAGSHEQRYLFRSGGDTTAWTWNAGERGISPHKYSPADLLRPINGTDLTLFDLQLPFLQWTDFVYEGIANVRGRPAHAFLLYPPSPLSASGDADSLVPAAVRVFLDTQFGAMTQAEWLDAAGKALKTVTVLDLKKIGEQWIVKSIDLRNHATRAKTRFAVTAAALDLQLPADLFDTDMLSQANPPVPSEKIERF